VAAKFNHLVVLMLENRSFDHMLGRLYHHDNPDPYHIIPRGQVFDGVSDDMFNTIFGLPGADIPPTAINAHRAKNFATPVEFDIGHSFNNVKTQIGGALPGAAFQMQGFIASRIAALKADKPTHTITQAEMAEPMAGFGPTTHTATGAGPFSDARVINKLARDFAVCDNWHASVPGPTFPNRSFLHAATSNGFVSNGSKKDNSIKKWSQHHAPTIFNLMKQHGHSAAIYHDGGGPDSDFPALVYELHPSISPTEFKVRSIKQFQHDAANGDLPNYSFIEPNVIGSDTNWHPNDQHPNRDIRWGEDLMQKVYKAVSTGKSWSETLLIITYDEHGGFFDHRFPPAAIPPSFVPGEDDYLFTQLGVRVPGVLISPRIQTGTVFHPTACFVDHTSVIRTLCARFNLPPLTPRDAAACDLSSVLGDTVRTDVPEIPAVDLPASEPANMPLNDLQQDYIALVAANRGVEVPHLETEEHGRAFLKSVASKPSKTAS
jgi:phospholipase C